MRTFEFSEGTSNKFWNIELTGKSFTVRFGKIGTSGQTQIKEYADESAAKKEHDKLVGEKLKKGYTETTKTSSAPAPVVAPPPPAPAAPAPPPAPAAETGKRTFEYSDATSNKFWNVERNGSSLTITYGRIGSAGQTQLKSFADESKAMKEADKLIAEKTGKGYRETTPSAKKAPASLRESLEAALVEDPEELANHMAYADYLTEQGDPLGDFIRIQLALEDTTRAANERKKLQQQEKKLLDAHARTWLGELAPFLLGDASVQQGDDYYRSEFTYTFRRGWLDTLFAKYPKVAFTRVLARAPQVRLLRELVIPNTGYEENFDRGDDVPENVDRPTFYPLARCDNFSNVKTLIVGEVLSEAEDDEDVDSRPSCHDHAEAIIGLIKRMPKLQELRLPAHRVDTKQLFALKTLDHLRILQVDNIHEYPLETLAKNPSLGNLTHLLCWPHGLEHGDKAYIRVAGVKAIVNSPHLKSLTHIRLRCSDAGDKGIKEIVTSGILKRLKMLDLRHGRVTNAGAKTLAACADAKGLKLDLCNNALTEEGITALKSAGIDVKAESQWDYEEYDPEEQEYLWCGDVE